jgi:hypothetical protein
MDLEKALDLRPIVKKFLDEWDKAVTSSAKQLLEEGYAVGNYYLQQRAGRKQVVDIDLVREKAAGHGVRPKDFDKCLTLSLTSLGNLIKDVAPKGKKTRHWDEFLDSCATAIEQSEPTEVIAKRK